MSPKKTTSASSDAPRRSTRTKKTPTSTSTSTSSSGKTKSSSQPRSKKTNPSPKKTYGSKHDTTDAPAAHNATPTHLPPKGTNVTWKAMPGWVKGHVLDIITSNTTIEGKSVKASKEDPRIVLKSHGPSGKIAVHKPHAEWFD
ncbi:uncharacterized protein SPSC_06065 [Sporisorium scitamineum]|uniref:Hypervirulence associated protein TUDOR domain-containing protein n=1 Tax=Sporisorium scitamineum TaxID=49012 RepID=A0A0F7S8V2_9BASI|nr:uncharacterized protein SPSC_06065 [Sporisorium scitamineum]CDW97073.1 hypothetical protein [Sporisorium scitamineum]